MLKTSYMVKGRKVHCTVSKYMNFEVSIHPILQISLLSGQEGIDALSPKEKTLFIDSTVMPDRRKPGTPL